MILCGLYCVMHPDQTQRIETNQLEQCAWKVFVVLCNRLNALNVYLVWNAAQQVIHSLQLVLFP